MHLKPMESQRTDANLAFHMCAACFRPYRDLFKRKTSLESPVSKPSGCFLYTSASRSPLMKAWVMLIDRRCKFSTTASAKTVLMAWYFAVGAKVSVKSKPGCWEKPLATRRALYCSIEPSVFLFTLKTQQQLIAVAPFGSWVLDHVPFRWCASSSSSAACVHKSASRQVRASLNVLGSF